MPRRNSTRVRLNLVGAAVLFVWGVLSLSSSVAGVQQAIAPKRVLVLYWYSRDYQADVSFEQMFQAVLETAPAGTVEYYPEYLESNRFPGENQSQLLRDYLQRKYADRTIDVVVAVTDAPLNFLLKYRNDLFPNAPIVFTVVKPPTPKEIATEPGMTGIIHIFSFKQTLDLALRLHPGTEQVFVVSGTIEHDKRFEAMGREKLQYYESRVSITYLTDLSPKELVDKTKSLPERSIVLYVWQQANDEKGRLLETSDILALIVNSTPVPIYGMASWQVGRGTVGGQVRINTGNATRAAEMALQIMNGERAQDIAVETTNVVPMFDWRELQRWGIDEDLLPPGSIVEFRVSSVWDEYKWHFVGMLMLFIFQAAVITGLVINRRHRKRAEEALRESERRFRNMADTAPVMIWVSGPDRLCDYLNQQWLDFTGRTLEEEVGSGRGEGIHPDDRERCLETYNSAFDRREPFTMEYRLRRADGQFRWVIDTGTARLSSDGSFLGYIGSCFDISERKAAEEALKSLSGQLIQAREDECARIARELHDDLNQRMALISIELEQLGQSSVTDGQLHKHIQSIMRQAAEVSREIHHISHDLHPSKLNQLGLIATVKSLCNDLQRTHRLKLEFTHEGVPARLSQEISLCLYRIVQECLHNVIKHSGAREAKVEIRGTANEIRLRVSDTGIGFDFESPGTKTGIGLVSMNERLRLVGGQISISSPPSQGTRIDVKVPLDRKDNDFEDPSPHKQTQAVGG